MKGGAGITVALTQMALLKRRYDTEYIALWAEELGLTTEQRAVLALYTAMHCVSFLGELGQRFNRVEVIPVEEQEVAYLTGILDQLLAAV